MRKEDGVGSSCCGQGVDGPVKPGHDVFRGWGFRRTQEDELSFAGGFGT